MKEYLRIQNFGPIVDIELDDIAPLTILIGESGSGKSTVMKVLSMFRWIYKRIVLRSYVRQAKIKKTAQGILDARALYPECSLADLYDELTMPPELRKAHQLNDAAVMEAYGFRTKDEQTGKFRWLTESETVAQLMQMYQELIK